MSLKNGNATSDSISITNSASIDTLTAWTTLMWLNLTALTGNRRYFAKASASGSRSIQVDATNTDELFLTQGYGSTNANYITNNADILVSKPLFIAVGYDEGAAAGDFFRAYVGTALPGRSDARACTFGTATDPVGSIQSDAANPLVIGNTQPTGATRAIQAYLSTVMHFSRRLSYAEILMLQAGPFLVPNCVLWFNFEQPRHGASYYDLSTRGNHGTVNGGTLGPIFPMQQKKPRRYWDVPAAAGGTVVKDFIMMGVIPFKR